MAVVSVTRLRVRSWLYMPSFVWHTFRSQRQVKRAPGLLRGALGNAPGLAFWTATVWADDASMKRFRDSGAHKKALPKLLHLCDEASVVRWTQDEPRVPSGAEMFERMRTGGRLSKVRRPSPGQQGGQTVPDGRPPRRGPEFTP